MSIAALTQFAGIQLYIWVKKGITRVQCLAQEHKAMTQAKARTRTARSGDERTNHEATAPPTRVQMDKLLIYASFQVQLSAVKLSTF